MKIKRYLVRDMQEAYLAIRRDLGLEAVIVATRKVRQPGLKGLFLPARLEVTAAVETLPQAKPATAAAGVTAPERGQPPPAPEVRTPAQPLSRPENSSMDGMAKLQRELGEIKAAITRLHSQGEKDLSGTTWQQKALLEQELGQELVQELLAGIETMDDRALISDIVRTRLADCLVNQVVDESRQRVQVFVGPTGVGKTTTLAKLAARFKLEREQKVGLITLDTYRIGAVDQLRTYAEIMGLPLEVAMTPRDFREGLEQLAACEVILVDTAGRAPDNKAMLAETQGFLEVVPEREVYLVLSSSIRQRDLLRAVEKFKNLDYNRLIFTKLDETTCPGVMVSVSAAAGVPMAYITTGQNVPDDLELAVPYLLAQRIWEAVEKHGSGGQVA